MTNFPSAVPEIPVTDLAKSIAYYQSHLGFTHDWGGPPGGIAQLSRGHCRLFLTDAPFRKHHGNSAPVLVWLNLNSKQEVDHLHHQWSASTARILSPPESKPWKLHEFTASD